MVTMAGFLTCLYFYRSEFCNPAVVDFFILVGIPIGILNLN